MEQLILASGACDPANDIICKPDNVIELFQFEDNLYAIGPWGITRTVFLILLAMVIVVALLFFGLRKKQMNPSKFGVTIESLMSFVRDDISIGIIGPEGVKYYPWLLSLFLFVLVGNLFEVTPLINFPITSRMAIAGGLSLLTWVIFVFVGLKKNGFRYVGALMWPTTVPIALRPLVGLIEVVSTFFLRPLTLAVRLFANMVAGHLMLTLLLVSGWVFMSSVGEIGIRALIGVPWFVFGLGIYVFEIIVAVLQAYIITLLSAVYVESSIHIEH